MLKIIQPYLIIMIGYGSSCLAFQPISAPWGGGQLKQSVNLKSAWEASKLPLASQPKSFYKSGDGDSKSRLLTESRFQLGANKAASGKRCATGGNWSVTRPSGYEGGSGQDALGLEEYLRNVKRKEEEKIVDPAPPQPDNKDKILLWFGVGMGGFVLVAGIIVWLMFRIKIPPCPKCQNTDKKTLRAGESCRTPSNFWVKCYCDACGYKWIQKGRRG